MEEMQEMQVWSLDGEDPLEEEMATHSSMLAWEIPWILATVHAVSKELVTTWWQTSFFPLAYGIVTSPQGKLTVA